MGINPESPKRLPLLPHDFLQKTNLADVKKIARERNYDMQRIVSMEPGSLESFDIIDVLCESANLDYIDTGLELTLEAKRDALHRASMIASTHTPEVTKGLILRHIADRKYLEIIIPLIQEAVVRGACYDDVEQISTFWKTLYQDGEPLAWLPLHRIDIEESADFPRYRGGATVMHSPSSSVNGKLEKQSSGSPSGKLFKAVPMTFDQTSAARCVRSWKEHSNGKFEAKLFKTSSPISAADVSDKQLLNLQLECLASATPSDVKVKVVTADRLFAILFAAASCGGAYDQGEAGAYGRLATWNSLAELVGVTESAPFDDVCNAVKQSGWCSIESTAKWFYNVAWDFGIVCVRPDKQHIAVLAASDED
jgi:hypothetical protein